MFDEMLPAANVESKDVALDACEDREELSLFEVGGEVESSESSSSNARASVNFSGLEGVGSCGGGGDTETL